MVRSIGADQVIDYTQEDFTKSGQRYDLILDIAAKRSVSDYKRALTPDGIFVLTGFSMAAMFGVLFLGPRISKTSGMKFVYYGAKANKNDLAYLKELLEAGKVVPIIDRRYTLSETPEAIWYYEKGHTRGKVVINI